MRPGTPDVRPPSAGMSIPLGVWLLGRGRGQGMNCFGTGSQAVLSALAPTLAVSLIGLIMAFLLPSGQHKMGFTRALVPLVCTLIQLVVSEVYARHLGRQGLWTRYATASLWCGWLPLMLMIVVQGVLKLVFPGLADSAASLSGVALGIQCYSLWLTWYVTRVGLAVTSLQAVIMTVLQTVVASGVLVLLWILPPHYNALVDMFGPGF